MGIAYSCDESDKCFVPRRTLPRRDYPHIHIANVVCSGLHHQNQNSLLVYTPGLCLNLNLNCLLVKRQIDNPSPGGLWWSGVVCGNLMDQYLTK